MTNELEKQFFDTFGIEPKYYCDNDYVFEAMLEDECTEGNMEKCKTCKKVGKTYPQITDSILLELICIAQSRFDLDFRNLCFDKIENLKYAVLEQILEYENREYNDSIKHQVRTLFEEG